MKKVLKNLVLVIIMMSIVSSILTISSNAATYSSEMKTLINKKYTDATKTDQKVNSITGTIITSIRIVGVAVAIVMLLAVAMKYMTAAPGDRADIKKSAIQYVVGAVVLFGVVGILEIISTFAKAFD